MVGTEEHLTCITGLPRAGDAAPFDQFPGEIVCLGFKFSVSWAGLPYHVTDDGYVLTSTRGKEYIALDADDIAHYQATHQLSDPLPTYEVPSGWYAAQFGTWALGAVILGAMVWRLIQKRRLARARETAEITTGGPVVERSGDREIADEIRFHLDANEVISHQAYACDREPDSVTASLSGHAHLAVLTDRRLILMTTRIGLFGMFRGKRRVSAFDRASITRIEADGETLFVYPHDKPPLMLFVPLTNSRFSSANQRAFLLDLPRLLGHRAA